ncbi:MAG: segregation/condensation protein A [Lachnospiraceae bacterium]|nr:segregation/condensation protein A [Robinsoniella sp.]MDY3766118.1 segregation/condensation protein A [Lachnospiraceae bacterium]
MGIPVKLQNFEGPLDLLLHLIDRNKVNIYDIPIAQITDQYMEYLHQMKEQDLNVMSEFLVMAATLLDIKARMLLPREETEEETEDPRSELVEQLLEYKMYKFMSYELRDRQKEAELAMFKKPTIPQEVLEYETPVDMEELLGDLTLAKLHQIFQEIMRKQESRIDPIRSRFGKIEKEEISLEEKMEDVLEYVWERKTCSFRNLLGRKKGKGKTQVIVTFLAILELMKMGKITIVQEHTFDDILITAREETRGEKIGNQEDAGSN